jgi:F-type H+-transporting ATPase subunit epsilon
MLVTIAKVHENLFSGEAQSLTAPTLEGKVTILSKHEPLVAPLTKGVITVRTTSGVKQFSIQDGVLEVSGNQATVLL